MNDPGIIIALILAYRGKWARIVWSQWGYTTTIEEFWFITGSHRSIIEYLLRRYGASGIPCDGRRIVEIDSDFTLDSIEEHTP